MMSNIQSLLLDPFGMITPPLVSQGKGPDTGMEVLNRASFPGTISMCQLVFLRCGIVSDMILYQSSIKDYQGKPMYEDSLVLRTLWNVFTSEVFMGQGARHGIRSPVSGILPRIQ